VKRTPPPELPLEEPLQPFTLPPFRIVPGDICPLCGRRTRKGVPCGWHKHPRSATPTNKGRTV